MMRVVSWTAAAVVGLAIGSSGALAGDYGDKLLFGSVTSLSIGNRDVNSSDEGGGNTFEFNSTSAYNIPIWRSVSMQLDSLSEYYSRANDHVDPISLTAFGAHLSYRNPNSGLVGIFGGYGWTSIRDGHGPDKYGVSMFGAEAQAYLGKLTLYGQAGFANSAKGDPGEGFHDGWFVRGVARYFPTPNSKLEAEISYAEADPYINGDKGQFTAWGVSYEHKLTEIWNRPIYGTLGYRGAYYDSLGNDHATEQVFRAGVKVMFGANTLLQNDRNGATLDLPSLPFRAAGQTENLD